MSLGRWSRLGDVAPSTLVEARLECHHALQFLTRVARGYLPTEPDDSHTSVTWNADLAAWTGRPVERAAPPFCLALRPQDLTLLVLNLAGIVTAQFHLSGRTLSEAGAWLEELLASRGLSPEPVRRPLHFEIADHPVAHGAMFALGDPTSFREISDYYANASLTLEAAARSHSGSSPVRCWPHHFDIATILPAGGEGRTISCGLSPGDGGYPQPYFYISPWPYPDAARLPGLTTPGHWHTEGWTGAVLLAEQLVALPAAEAQQGLAENFVERTVSLLLGLAD